MTRHTAPGTSEGRRPSWLVVVGFLVALVPWVVGFLAFAQFNNLPPMTSNDGFEWTAGMFGLSALFIITTGIAAPCAVLLSTGGLRAIHALPQRLFGRRLAWLTILMSATIFSAAVVFVCRFNSHGTAAASSFPATQPPPTIDHDNQNAVTDLTQLLYTCDRYSVDHHGAYPPDVASLAEWAKANGQVPIPQLLADYVYCGDGLNRKAAAATQPGDGLPIPDRTLIVWISRPLPPDGRRGVAVIAGMFNQQITFHPPAELPALFNACNESRRRLGLSEEDFNLLTATSRP